MRSNLIGHTIFLTGEKYRMTNNPNPNPNSTRYYSHKWWITQKSKKGD